MGINVSKPNYIKKSTLRETLAPLALPRYSNRKWDLSPNPRYHEETTKTALEIAELLKKHPKTFAEIDKAVGTFVQKERHLGFFKPREKAYKHLPPIHTYPFVDYVLQVFKTALCQPYNRDVESFLDALSIILEAVKEHTDTDLTMFANHADYYFKSDKHPEVNRRIKQILGVSLSIADEAEIKTYVTEILPTEIAYTILELAGMDMGEENRPFEIRRRLDRQGTEESQVALYRELYKRYEGNIDEIVEFIFTDYAQNLNQTITDSEAISICEDIRKNLNALAEIAGISVIETDYTEWGALLGDRLPPAETLANLDTGSVSGDESLTAASSYNGSYDGRLSGSDSGYSYTYTYESRDYSNISRKGKKTEQRSLKRRSKEGDESESLTAASSDFSSSTKSYTDRLVKQSASSSEGHHRKRR